MGSTNAKLTLASADVDAAVAAPTVIDPDELQNARLDERWRQFCLNAEHYVAETTRSSRRAEQTA